MNRFMFRNLLTAQCGIAKDALVDQSTIQAGIHMNWITTLPGSSSCYLYFVFDWLVSAYVIVFALYVIMRSYLLQHMQPWLTKLYFW